MIGVSVLAPAGVTPSEQGGRAGREQALGVWVPNWSSTAVTCSIA
jgi:hypothetical protein